VIAQILVWWGWLALGAAIGLVAMAIIAAGKMDRLRGRFLREREAHLEIINNQLEEISSLKFYAEFRARKLAGKEDKKQAEPDLEKEPPYGPRSAAPPEERTKEDGEKI
jgi:hypothetical protein